MNRFLVPILLGLVASFLFMASPSVAAPIVSSTPPPSLPSSTGAAAKPRPVPGRSRAPQNPFLAKDPFSNIHNDTWMSDTYPVRGPLGRGLVSDSESARVGVCSSITFDRRGRIISICPAAVFTPQARIIDPDSLEVIDTYDLPNATDLPGTVQYQNFAGGGYFYLDNRDRIWVATKTNHLYVLGFTDDGQEFKLLKDHDLTSKFDPAAERITSALPDFKGRVWIVAKQTGRIGILNRKTGKIKAIELNEGIQNSFTVGRKGIYIASNKRMYRFGTSKRGFPKVVWKVRYKNSGIVKPGQADAGTGTTPTVLKGGYVAITDNADRMNVVVYRTGRKLHGKRRRVCQVPVFNKGTSATENSLIGTGRSLIVESNYGYTNPFASDGPSIVTEPGFTRIDIKKNGRGCRRVWTNTEIRTPSAVSKLSTKTGLIYTYTRPPDPSGSQGYYWAAIKYRNGKTAWTKYAGSGFNYNNNYSGMGLGPDGTAYIGVIGGMLSLRDR
ncbi:MAG: hypothetical protein IPK93_05340 [Solirubrobacterales bacterium]|nr:hypothetical protein [Solirubrobacterales bacterium]